MLYNRTPEAPRTPVRSQWRDSSIPPSHTPGRNPKLNRLEMAGALIANTNDSYRASDKTVHGKYLNQGKRLSEMNNSLPYGFDVPARHPLSETNFGNSVY